MFLNFRIKDRSPCSGLKNIIGESTVIVDEWSYLMVNLQMGECQGSATGLVGNVNGNR